MNKKGAFQAEIIAQFFSYVALFLVLMVFFILFSIRGCTDEPKIVGEEITQIDTSVVLLNYLRTPVDEDNTITELIAKDPENYDSIQEESEKIFKHLESESAFQVLVNIDEDECIFDCGNVAMAACAAKYGLETASIPTYEGEVINVGFCLWQDGSARFNTKEYECRKRTGC